MSAGVVLYLRVSTEEQDLAGQERELRAYAATRDWFVVGVYREKVSASGRVERTQHDQLLQDAAVPGRGWSRVLVWALDRWSRDPSFVRAIGSIEELEGRGVFFHSFREPFLDSSLDESTRMQRELLRGILPTIANFEARRRSERTQVAMEELKSGRRRTRSGKPVGRPKRVTAELVQEISRLRFEKLPWKKIALRLHIPAASARKWHSTWKRAQAASTGEIPHAINGPPMFGAATPAPPQAELPPSGGTTPD